MAATTTTLAQLIRQKFAPGFIDGVWRNNALLGKFPAPMDSGGDTAFRWKINSTGNTSTETFTEGQVQPSAGNQGWVSAAVSYLHYRFMVQITGHARAAMRSNWVDGIAEEMILGRRDLLHLINTTSMSGTDGLETAVDSTTTYAGITRGSATYFESQETAVSGAISITAIEDLIEGALDNDRGANEGNLAWFMPYNQNTNIYRLTGTPALQQIPDTDKIPGFLNQQLSGYPINRIPNWTDTVIMLLDMSEGNFEYVEHEPFTVKEMGPSGDSDIMQVSWRGILVCKNPKVQSKLTGVTA